MWKTKSIFRCPYLMEKRDENTLTAIGDIQVGGDELRVGGNEGFHIMIEILK